MTRFDHVSSLAEVRERRPTVLAIGVFDGLHRGHQNFCGEYYISESVKEFKRLQKLLKEKSDIDLILVFEPGKATTFPEQIPCYMKANAFNTNNYFEFVRQCTLQGVSCLDLQNYFLSIKDSCKYPLYSPYGVHWTTYGMYLAADTLLSYIRNNTGWNTADIKIGNIEVTDTTRDVDFDLEKTLNLPCDLPSLSFAFPEIKWDTAGKDKPKALVIADSYYWSFFDKGITDNAFSNKEYWYYYKTVYPYIWMDNSKWIRDIDRKAVYSDQDIILVMITELNLHRAFWGFTDELLDEYDNAYTEMPLFKTMKFILSDEILYPMVIDMAGKWSCTFETALKRMAETIIRFEKEKGTKQKKEFWSAYRKLKIIRNQVL